jgi:hypothetical protein
MHAHLPRIIVLFALLAGSTAVAQGMFSMPAPPAVEPACRQAIWRPQPPVSVVGLRFTNSMQNDSDSVDIRPGERTFLEPNFPNPFPVTTTIAYSISEDTRVELKVFDFDYVEVATLVDADQTKGRHIVIFDTRELELRAPTGMYFYQLKTSQGIEQRRMIYMK